MKRVLRSLVPVGEDVEDLKAVAGNFNATLLKMRAAGTPGSPFVFHSSVRIRTEPVGVDICYDEAE
jgi:hypothetical protein